MTYESLQKFYSFSGAQEVTLANYLSLPLEYYNPTGKKNDCVVRAISKAYGIDHNIVRDTLKMHEKVLSNGQMYTEPEVYGDYIVKQCEAIAIDVKAVFGSIDGYKLSGIFKKGTYLVRVKQHLYCMKEGVVYDCWNPLGEEIKAI